ncbi:Spore protein YkvP [Anoxybacillus sp. P3H1B]|uniref:CgeB family protein n=1 Tax=Anoxybacillaceae TaxID=3120669 RepID=UPI000797A345|nr:MULTISPECIES: glycosyltransferase [Anoxybacillus]KXG09597.1 Spore protein YkvP [Anoxybacillus sp. P3H1B]
MDSSPLKIVFIGRYTEGETGIVRSIQMGLLENGYQVHEINLKLRPHLIYNPYRRFGGHGPVYVKWPAIKEEVARFQPDIILFCAGGLTFQPEVLEEVKKYCTVIGITLSDPDVYPTVRQFVGKFDYHTTNSVLSYKQYKKAGITNTFYMPFGIDSRFFIPREPVAKYQSDVSIIGHYRPNRLEIAQSLQDIFQAKIFGRGWPLKSEGPVYGEEWFQAMHSAKMVVNFPKTGAGYTNVKVGVFEAVATGRLLFTEYFDEMRQFFEYDKEIVGYKNKEDLIGKIRYYLDHPDEAEAIARAGQERCAKCHTWKQRLHTFFSEITLKTPEKSWSDLLQS